jgi:hypothetical protein
MTQSPISVGVRQGPDFTRGSVPFPLHTHTFIHFIVLVLHLEERVLQPLLL